MDGNDVNVRSSEIFGSTTHTVQLETNILDDLESTEDCPIAYRIFFFLGLGSLFPWNAFITASSYFYSRLCGTTVQNTFENYFSLSFNLFQISGLYLSLRYCTKWPQQRKVVIPLAIYSSLFAICCLMVFLGMDAMLFFEITLLCVSLCGLCGSLLSAGLFGCAAQFPVKYTGALMNGQGISALIVCLANVISLTADSPPDICNDDDNSSSCGDNSFSYSALAYFLVATTILVLNIFAFFILRRLPISR